MSVDAVMARPAQSIQINDVSKTYLVEKSDPVVALEPVRLDLNPGEFFSLVGPSGCGKSTILNVVAGLLDATTGNVVIGGREVTEPDNNVGIVFQKPTLLRWLTVRENIMLPAKIARSIDADTRARATELLELAGLADFVDRYPNELSGGMQQRASIVRALVSDPPVLLMDEPFSALDEFTREVLNDELLRLWTVRPKTVIFITHNIAEAVYLSDRVGVMTSRPGRLQRIVDIDLARPRGTELRSDDYFYDLVRDVRSSIGTPDRGAAA
ncbi:ABC transporter ATP-binding protein [Aeromicrobium sp. YIM 150415]|uniref:ABC transporter ATP-binding protein n=1 Tax=Aeromicrobium sp. YIM 150415 TaxID=2803912 RepID=UPI00196555CE|nr:ABC transporter ATP-binding protein [Aeromicrobium sp. YIM 150415]MBM9462422.1 ABC transporter ATP-binding protein [Aeromicrobium sp. YIM 150415]